MCAWSLGPRQNALVRGWSKGGARFRTVVLQGGDFSITVLYTHTQSTSTNTKSRAKIEENLAGLIALRTQKNQIPLKNMQQRKRNLQKPDCTIISQEIFGGHFESSCSMVLKVLNIFAERSQTHVLNYFVYPLLSLRFGLLAPRLVQPPVLGGNSVECDSHPGVAFLLVSLHEYECQGGVGSLLTRAGAGR